MSLSRHTGEVARRAGGGKPQSRRLQFKIVMRRRSFMRPSPSAPFGGTSLPRMTGEAGGSVLGAIGRELVRGLQHQAIDPAAFDQVLL